MGTSALRGNSIWNGSGKCIVSLAHIQVVEPRSHVSMFRVGLNEERAAAPTVPGDHEGMAKYDGMTALMIYHRTHAAGSSWVARGVDPSFQSVNYRLTISEKSICFQGHKT